MLFLIFVIFNVTIFLTSISDNNILVKILEATVVFNDNKEMQNIVFIDYELQVEKMVYLLDMIIFSDYYNLAYDKLQVHFL